MTPTELLDEFKTFCEYATKDLVLPSRASPNEHFYRPPEVWKMRLPDRKSETNKAPYILLQLVTGNDSQAEGEQPESECNIRVVVCCYCSDASEGALNVLNVITRLRTALLRQRVVGKKFTLKMPLEYMLYPDDTAPYFMGEMMTIWELPTIQREVRL